MDISGLDKAELLAALFNGSHQQGLGRLDKSGARDMTVSEAREELAANPRMYFDYLRGRVLKVDLGASDMRTALYNRDLGEGAAERIVERLRAKYRLTPATDYIEPSRLNEPETVFATTPRPQEWFNVDDYVKATSEPEPFRSGGGGDFGGGGASASWDAPESSSSSDSGSSSSSDSSSSDSSSSSNND
jgi:hypothetical protein